MKSLLHIFTSRRMLAVLLLGFSSGLPLALTGATLQAWMADKKVDLTIIGLFALVGLPYTTKFLWSPFMERFVPPLLGRRRGWMLIMQVLLAMTIILMGQLDPVSSPGLMAAVAFAVAFFSASQDIVINAYTTEVLDKEELGLGSANYMMGYRVAMLVSGAIALILSDHMSWSNVYLIMGISMFIGIFTTFWSPEPILDVAPPKSLKEAVVDPFVDFFTRKGWAETLAFIVLYKLDVVVATALMTPFMMEVGFTKSEIGYVSKGFGLVATILGAYAGGILMLKLKMKKSLWFFGIAQGISGLAFISLAHFGKVYSLLVLSIAAENFFSGMGTTAYAAFLMSLCNKKFTATQYALLSSLMAITRVFAGSPAGYMAKNMGWEMYYIVATLLMIPGLMLLPRISRKMQLE